MLVPSFCGKWMVSLLHFVIPAREFAFIMSEIGVGDTAEGMEEGSYQQGSHLHEICQAT